MKLTAGILINSQTTKETEIFIADQKTEITLIQLTNESATSVIVNVFVQYDDIVVRIEGRDIVIPTDKPLVIERKYELGLHNKILFQSSIDNAVSYIVQGEYIPEEEESIIDEATSSQSEMEMLLEQLYPVLDVRYGGAIDKRATKDASFHGATTTEIDFSTGETFVMNGFPDADLYVTCRNLSPGVQYFVNIHRPGSPKTLEFAFPGMTMTWENEGDIYAPPNYDGYTTVYSFIAFESKVYASVHSEGH